MVYMSRKYMKLLRSFFTTWFFLMSSVRAFQHLDESVIREGFFGSFDHVVTDIDGVLYVEDKLLPRAAETLALFRREGKKIIFLTNDDYSHRTQKIKKLKEFGIQVSLEEIFTSGYCAAVCLNSLNTDKLNKQVYISGMQGLAAEFSDMGFQCLPIGPEDIPDNIYPWLDDATYASEDVCAVVIGFDSYISYPKLRRAMEYLDKPNVTYIATHMDARYLLKDGRSQPGIKGFVEAVNAVSGRTPLVTGKPSPYALKCIQEIHPDLNPARAIMIGDSLNSDILFGSNVSMRTLFVLTGVHNLDDVRQRQDSPDRKKEVPDFYIESLEALYDLLIKFPLAEMTHGASTSLNLHLVLTCSYCLLCALYVLY